ncbi:hypothetical protein SAMN04488096_10426 [Mesonia phycicola]|uniref:Uncharacterized protein n=1 Tax=Mesonia phycicola TaxID=579105 RepID=A0A1M6DJC1_9FLAO|nr:hypothetical protein [Mesonia phycicola]SHI73260.1 hypothetical protein SAMN04488096_10426 [Mesonia phycicola]
MKTIVILLFTSVIATLCMSAFSYLYSNIINQNFKEPQLLNILIQRLSLVNFTKQIFIGWLLHLFTGVIFMVGLYFLWQNYIVPNWFNTLLLGVVLGLIGALIWKITFSLHPNPPNINLSHYIIHLILAHVVFSYSAWVVLKLLFN